MIHVTPCFLIQLGGVKIWFAIYFLDSASNSDIEKIFLIYVCVVHYITCGYTTWGGIIISLKNIIKNSKFHITKSQTNNVKILNGRIILLKEHLAT